MAAQHYALEHSTAPLEQGAAFTGRPGAALGSVRGKLALVGQEALPADGAGMLVVAHSLPAPQGLLDAAGADEVLGVGAPLGVHPAGRAGAGVGRVAQGGPGLALAATP